MKEPTRPLENHSQDYKIGAYSMEIYPTQSSTSTLTTTISNGANSLYREESDSIASSVSSDGKQEQATRSSRPTTPLAGNNNNNNNTHTAASGAAGKRRRHGSEDESGNRDVILLCLHYLKTNNHAGLALLARQRGVPPTLRRRVWPVLLKYHPYVISPFISPNVENDEDAQLPADGKIRRELLKYFRVRTKAEENVPSGSSSPNSMDNNNGNSPSPVEDEIVRILEAAIYKFFNKWGAITKYDSGFAWIALGLAEWFPPIPNSNYVLIGRDCINKNDPLNRHLTQLNEYTEDSGTLATEEEFVLDHHSMSTLDENAQLMTFAEVYERLVLVLLHSKEEKDGGPLVELRRGSVETLEELHPTKTITDLISSNSLNQQELLFKTGKIETRVQFFLVAFAKLLPELYRSLSEDDMLNNNSNKHSQWLTWWLKYCGAKALNKFDRGRLWDLLLGFRYHYNQFADEYHDSAKVLKRFKKLYDVDLDLIDTKNVDLSSDIFWYKPGEANELKWCQIDYQLQMTFVYVAILQRNEGKLLELDQVEIAEFLNRLPPCVFHSDSQVELSSDSSTNDFNKVLKSAGELWRGWLWNEIRDEIND